MQTKEEKKAYRQKWLASHREHVRERNKRWEQRNPEKRRKSANESYHRHEEKNRVRRLERASRWYYANKDRILPEKKARYRKLAAELKEPILQHYGRKCNCCGLDDTRFLTVDHANHGKGNRLPKVERDLGSIQMYRKVIASGFSKAYQILCMNCNWARGCWGKCFHQTDKEK